VLSAFSSGSTEAIRRRVLKALGRKKKLPQSEVIEALIREEYGKG
jgi:hypothetical protein